MCEDPRLLAQLRRETSQDWVPTLKISGEWLVETDAREVARGLGLPEPARVLMAW